MDCKGLSMEALPGICYDTSMDNDAKIESAVFAGGCFWCTEAIFKGLKGVVSVMPGYTGGTLKNPTYYDVAGGNTGHAEAIKIDFNPAVISFRDLLEVFFSTHDPTSLNKQGADTGTEYRSAIFYSSPEQKAVTQEFIKELVLAGTFDKPIVTTLEPLAEFYPAEQEHMDFAARNPNSPYCAYVINPKLEKFKKKYSQLLK